MLQGSIHHTPLIGSMSSFLPPTPSLEQNGAMEAKKGEVGSTDFLAWMSTTETMQCFAQFEKHVF